MRSTVRNYRLLLATLFFALTAVAAPLYSTRVIAKDDPLTGDLHVTHADLDAQYHTAIIDGMEMRASKIRTNLVLITKANTSLQWKTVDGKDYVKMGVLTDTFYDSYVGKSLAVGAGRTTWVFSPAEMKHWYATHTPLPNTLLLRLRQLLGMPPNVQKTRIAEVWVQPQDLKRPSIEPAIDKEIDLATLFSRKTWYTPNGDDAYNTWFYQQCANSYVIPTDRASVYPWTRLGYTYDWGNPEYPHIGLSEFIIWGSPTVSVLVESCQKPEDYFK